MRRALYANLAADLGTPEDLAALRWVTQHHSPALLHELLALDAKCAVMVRTGAAEAELRTAVGCFVARVREIRRLYREATRAS